MTKLKTTTKTIIDESDWSEFVSKTYGRPYRFQQQEYYRERGLYAFSVPLRDKPEDYGQDTIVEVVNGEDRSGVSFAAWLARDPKAPVEGGGEDGAEDYVIKLFWHRSFYPSFDMVVADLHAKDLIDEGEYSIEIGD